MRIFHRKWHRDRGRWLGLGAMLLLASGSWTTAAELPIGLTGWTQDVIAEKAASDPLSATTSNYQGTAAVDWVWFETGATNAPNAFGLPSSGSFVSAVNSNVTFQYQPYTSNNALLTYTANPSGTVTLITPASYSDLAFLTSAQGGGNTWSATLHFSDSSTTTLNSTPADPDWTSSSADAAISTLNVVARGNSWSGFYGGPIYMVEHDFTLSAGDQAKTLVSIDYTGLTGANNDLFAISGQLVPEPSSCVLLGLGALGLVGYSWRRRRPS